MAKTFEEKTLRLLAEGRVEPDPAPAQVFRVTGDHGIYTVVAGAHIALCTCPATARCTHIEAVVARMTATETELALMDAALEMRRADDAEKAEAIFARLEA